MVQDQYTIDARQFNRVSQKFIRETKGKFSQKIRKIALMILIGIVDRNPIDTGLSQNNWQVDVGQVNNDILGTDGDPIARAESVLATIRNWGIGEVIFIFNNVEYTIYLEFGTDKMAPFAMVRDTLSSVSVSLT